jgi:hypothetical protein
MQHHLDSLVQLLYLDVGITQQEEQKEKKCKQQRKVDLEAGRHHKKGRKRKREKGKKKASKGRAVVSGQETPKAKSQPKSQRENRKDKTRQISLGSNAGS